MTNVQEAVKLLQKRGMAVQALCGPQGWRYQIKSRNGTEYQISHEELLLLGANNKLTWGGVVEIATKPRS